MNGPPLLGDPRSRAGESRAPAPLSLFGYAAVSATILGILAILERAGAPRFVSDYALLAWVLAAAVVSGFLARTLRLSDFLSAGDQLSPLWNGLALGASAVTGVFILGSAGPALDLGWDGIPFLIGPGVGLALMAVLVAPAFRKSGAASVPEFLALRYGGIAIRLLAALAVILVCLDLLTAELAGAGLLVEKLIGLPQDLTIILGAIAILTVALLGGIGGLTLAQVGLGVTVLLALVLPLVILFEAGRLPSLAGALADLSAARGGRNFGAFSHVGFDGGSVAALLLALIAGTAAMPHLLVRAGTVATPRGAALSFVPALVVVLVAYLAMGAQTIFAEWLSLSDSRPIQPLAIATLPGLSTSLFAAGGLAAALAAGAALAHTLAVAAGHDIYVAVLDRDTPQGRQLLIIRLLILVGTVGAALLALRIPDPFRVAATALAIAAGALFPALAVSRWRRARRLGALPAVALGLAIVLAPAVTSFARRGAAAGWFGPGVVGSGALAAGVGLLVLVVTGLVGRRPATPGKAISPPAGPLK